MVRILCHLLLIFHETIGSTSTTSFTSVSKAIKSSNCFTLPLDSLLILLGQASSFMEISVHVLQISKILPDIGDFTTPASMYEARDSFESMSNSPHRYLHAIVSADSCFLLGANFI